MYVCILYDTIAQERFIVWNIEKNISFFKMEKIIR